MRKNSFGHRAFKSTTAASLASRGSRVSSAEWHFSPELRRRSRAHSPAAGTLRQAAEARHITIGAAAASVYLGEAEYSAILGSEFSSTAG